MPGLVKFEQRVKQELIQCEVCGKTIKGKQGHYGHLLMAHGIRRARRETLLAEEVERLKADMVRKEQQINKLVSDYDLRVAELQERCAGYEAHFSDVEAKQVSVTSLEALIKELDVAGVEDESPGKGVSHGWLTAIALGAYYLGTQKAGDGAPSPVSRLLGHDKA